MEQGKIMKTKRCIVKLNRLGIVEDLEIVRDRMLDQRIRKCQVLVRRCDFSKYSKASVPVSFGQFKVRRCCVRLPKLNLEYAHSLERSSSSVLSDSDFEIDNGRKTESA